MTYLASYFGPRLDGGQGLRFRQNRERSRLGLSHSAKDLPVLSQPTINGCTVGTLLAEPLDRGTLFPRGWVLLGASLITDSVMSFCHRSNL